MRVCLTNFPPDKISISTHSRSTLGVAPKNMTSHQHATISTDAKFGYHCADAMSQVYDVDLNEP
jgi:hypothetical protein